MFRFIFKKEENKMDTIGEKISYLKGLFEGLKIDENKDEGKILKGVLDVLSEISLAIDDIDEEVAELNELVDEIDEDLGYVEDDIYGEDDFDDEDTDFYEITCPKCGDIIYLEDSEIFDDGIICPECGEKIDIDLNDMDEEE